MRRVAIAPDMTAGQLAERLGALAAEVVQSDLSLVARGVSPKPQDSAHATYAPPIERRHCLIDFNREPDQIVNQVRALAPRPGAATSLDGKRLRVLATSVVALERPEPGECGRIIRCEGDQIWVHCGRGLLRIENAQLEGKRALDARDLVNGRTLRAGQFLGT
jgi:methionyl-tRNA formyltransferase